MATEPKKQYRRTTARLAAVQALYQVEISGLAPGEVIREFVEHRLEEENDGLQLGQIDQELFAAVIEGVSVQSSDLDDMLTAVLPDDWPTERLERVLLIILRAAALELSQWPEIPARVVIKEYVDIAHAFFAERETGMANAILDRIARILRPDEFDDASAVLDRVLDLI